jgi:protein arginine N-methyltransferase 5
MLGLASEWLELDHAVEGIRFDSEIASRFPIPVTFLSPLTNQPPSQALKQEVAYASHLHVSTLIIPPPRNPDYISDYARAINAALLQSNYVRVRCGSVFRTIYPSAYPHPSQLSIRTPVSDPKLGEDPASTWDMWNTIRTHCAYNQRLDLSTCPLSVYGRVPRFIDTP